MNRKIFALFLVTSIVVTTANAFLEDIYLDEDVEPVITTTTTTPAPPPPPPLPPRPSPPINECTHYCRNISSCKDILREYQLHQQRQRTSSAASSRDCAYEFNWHCFSHRYYGHCVALSHCPADHIRSGFGRSFDRVNRCIPLYMCQYFAKIFSHVNDLHQFVEWC